MKKYVLLVAAMVMTMVAFAQNDKGEGYEYDDGSDIDIENCLNFTAVGGKASVALCAEGKPEKVSLQFSLDGGKVWLDYVIGQKIELEEGAKVLFKAKKWNENFGNKCCRKMFTTKNPCRPCRRSHHLKRFSRQRVFRDWNYKEYSCGKKGGLPYYHFVMSGNVAADGNVLSLLDEEFDVEDDDMSLPCFAFYRLFAGCESLVQAPKLPCAGLSYQCYDQMFAGCTSLTSAPELPSTDLDYYCYYKMFAGCTSLREAPELPAKDLSYSCYERMFDSCVSLTVAPALELEYLDEWCCCAMFADCWSLTAPPVLKADGLNTGCFAYMFLGCKAMTEAPELGWSELSSYCYMGMFAGCELLREAPVLKAYYLEDGCYDAMFAGCVSLTEAPALPAMNLVYECYKCMFRGCKSLMRTPVLPATDLAVNCYESMFEGCCSLTEVPDLPAIRLYNGCYYRMFKDCVGLRVSSWVPGEELGLWREWQIPENASLLDKNSRKWGGDKKDAKDWNDDMFENTGGTYKDDPDIGEPLYVPGLCDPRDFRFRDPWIKNETNE